MESPESSKIVYRITSRDSGKIIGSYSRAYHDEYDFDSPSEAWNANCHGMFKDDKKYKIGKYLLTYKLIEDDVKGEGHGY